MSLLVDAIIGIPLDSTGRFEGCERMPAALRAAGLDDWTAIDRGNLQVVLADPRRDPDTGVTAGADLLAASAVIADAMSRSAGRGERSLVVGGDCSLLVGLMNGIRRVDPHLGLVMVDGHFDLHTPATSESGDAADMEVALLLGLGDERFASLGGGVPPMRADRVAYVGPRDHDEMRRFGSPLPHELDPAPFVAEGIDPRPAVEHLRGRGCTGFWVHVDLDVLSTEAMPAVDYPQPGGLSWDDLHDVVAPLVRDDGFRGLSVAILNPTLDPDGAAAGDTVLWLRSVLER